MSWSASMCVCVRVLLLLLLDLQATRLPERADAV